MAVRLCLGGMACHQLVWDVAQTVVAAAMQATGLLDMVLTWLPRFQEVSLHSLFACQCMQ
jgi:hypothetical protein